MSGEARVCSLAATVGSLPVLSAGPGCSGCRADANDAVLVLLPLNITVLALDFSGSGLSQGEHVSLGKFEVRH